MGCCSSCGQPWLLQPSGRCAAWRSRLLGAAGLVAAGPVGGLLGWAQALQAPAAQGTPHPSCGPGEGGALGAGVVLAGPRAVAHLRTREERVRDSGWQLDKRWVLCFLGLPQGRVCTTPIWIFPRLLKHVPALRARYQLRQGSPAKDVSPGGGGPGCCCGCCRYERSSALLGTVRQ